MERFVFPQTFQILKNAENTCSPQSADDCVICARRGQNATHEEFRPTLI